MAPPGFFRGLMMASKERPAQTPSSDKASRGIVNGIASTSSRKMR